MHSLDFFGVSKLPLATEIQTLEYNFMKFGISEKGEVLANIEVIPTFIEEMKDKHFEDDSLSELTGKEISTKLKMWLSRGWFAHL